MSDYKAPLVYSSMRIDVPKVREHDHYMRSEYFACLLKQHIGIECAIADEHA